MLLYSTLTVAFDAYMWLFDRLGRASMGRLMGWTFLVVGLILALFLLFFLPKRKEPYLAFALICLAVAYCVQIIDVPANLFHFLQYGPLTVLVFDALHFHCKDRSIYVWSLTLVVILGVRDETLQSLLPNRYFALEDIILNSAAGLFSLAFIGFVIGEENYPWPRSVAG